MSLTAKQIQILHVARSATRMPEDHYRALLSRYGAESSKDAVLQPRDYHEMMDVFRQLGFSRRPPRPATPAGGTTAQVRLVERLARERAIEPSRLAGIIRRVTGRDAAPSNPFRFLGRRDLSKLIQALRRWNYEAEPQTRTQTEDPAHA